MDEEKLDKITEPSAMKELLLESDKQMKMHTETYKRTIDFSKSPLVQGVIEMMQQQEETMKLATQTARWMTPPIEEWIRPHVLPESVRYSTSYLRNPVMDIERFAELFGKPTSWITERTVMTNIPRMLGNYTNSFMPDKNEVVESILRQLDIANKWDGKFGTYEDNPVFWENLKKMSRRLINIPQEFNKELFELLSQDQVDVNEVERLIGKFDIEALEVELEDSEHMDYQFREYLSEILEAYRVKPENFRIFIPALLLIIEGSLSTTFKSSKKGTQSEIKRKLNIFWDMFQYRYLTSSTRVRFSFQIQVMMTNIKEMFHVLTVSRVTDEVKINRNLILHGKSDPKDWKESDFLTLLNLLYTILVTRKSISILLDEFKEMPWDGRMEKTFELTEYRNTLIQLMGSAKLEDKKSVTHVKREFLKLLKTDLSGIFDGDRELAETIASRSNVHALAVELVDGSRSVVLA